MLRRRAIVVEVVAAGVVGVVVGRGLECMWSVLRKRESASRRGRGERVGARKDSAERGRRIASGTPCALRRVGGLGII